MSRVAHCQSQEKFDRTPIIVNNERNGYLQSQSIKERIDWDVKRSENIVNHLYDKLLVVMSMTLSCRFKGQPASKNGY